MVERVIFVEIGVSLVGNHTYVPYTSGDVRILIRRWIHLPDLSDVNILVMNGNSLGNCIPTSLKTLLKCTV